MGEQSGYILRIHLLSVNRTCVTVNRTGSFKTVNRTIFLFIQNCNHLLELDMPLMNLFVIIDFDNVIVQ